MACGILVPWPGIKLVSPALQGGFLTTWLPGKPRSYPLLHYLVPHPSSPPVERSTAKAWRRNHEWTKISGSLDGMKSGHRHCCVQPAHSHTWATEMWFGGLTEVLCVLDTLLPIYPGLSSNLLIDPILLGKGLHSKYVGDPQLVSMTQNKGMRIWSLWMAEQELRLGSHYQLCGFKYITHPLLNLAYTYTKGILPHRRKNFGEGSGNPLQDSCLENPMDGGAW